MELKTPLYDTHIKYGGKVVPFAGWLLPVQYEGITAEHMAVRCAAGLFDVSHMGEVTYEGADALANLQKLLTNDFSDMYDGQVRYSPMCNDNGGVVDDLIVYRKNEQSYMVVVNAANHDKDVAWMKSHLFGDVKFEDISFGTAELALQGPNALAILSKLAAPETLPKKYYSFASDVDVDGISCIVSRTGYTGEAGFELYTANENAPALWEKLMSAGAEEGLVPCGLGARDTLRLEASMPLYGHEMDDTVMPVETNLGNFVKLAKEDFIGKAAILAAGEPKRTRIGLELVGRGIARDGDTVYSGDTLLGKVSSGTMCPYLKKAVAMAIVPVGTLNPGDAAQVEVRGRRIDAVVTVLPFYSRKRDR